MTKDEALRLALEALEKLFGIPDKWTGEGEGDVAVWRLGGSYRAQQAITAIKAALEAKDSDKGKVDQLRVALMKANNQAEHFEREWYLRGDEIERLKAALEAKDEPVAFKIYKPTPPRGAIPNVRDAELPWVYDQDPSSGNVASMWVTPVQTLRSKS